MNHSLSNGLFSLVLIINIDGCKVNGFTAFSFDGEDNLKKASACYFQVQNLCISF